MIGTGLTAYSAGAARPIRGRYAAGIAIGPALPFGYIAARPAAAAAR